MEGSTRRVTFIEEDDGLASLADMEAGFSGNHHYPILMRSSGFSPSYRALSSPPPPPPPTTTTISSSSTRTRSPRFYQSSRFEDHQPHFLEACFLCKKSLRDNRDIFMYRGDTPFCSEECREAQIEIDEDKEKNWNLSVGSMKQALRKEKKKTSTSPNKSPNYPVRSGTVAAA